VVSKGLGQIARVIDAMLKAKPDATFTVSELCRHVYGDEPKTKARLGAVRKALPSVLARNPDWSDEGGITRRNHPAGRGGDERMIYNMRSWASVKEAAVAAI
jgi:hypothetical protein